MKLNHGALNMYEIVCYGIKPLLHDGKTLFGEKNATEIDSAQLN